MDFVYLPAWEKTGVRTLRHYKYPLSTLSVYYHIFGSLKVALDCICQIASSERAGAVACMNSYLAHGILSMIEYKTYHLFMNGFLFPDS